MPSLCNHHEGTNHWQHPISAQPRHWRVPKLNIKNLTSPKIKHPTIQKMKTTKLIRKSKVRRILQCSWQIQWPAAQTNRDSIKITIIVWQAWRIYKSYNQQRRTHGVRKTIVSTSILSRAVITWTRGEDNLANEQGSLYRTVRFRMDCTSCFCFQECATERICIHYRPLNVMTVANSYRIPIMP